jgi:hypothetical protein
MRKPIKELKALSTQELEAYFKQILLEDYNISSERFDILQSFLSDLSTRKDLESILDVVEVIKHQNFTTEETILCVASKVSEVNFLRNKLAEAEQIIHIVQRKDALEDMMSSHNIKEEEDSFVDFKEDLDSEE